MDNRLPPPLVTSIIIERAFYVNEQYGRGFRHLIHTLNPAPRAEHPPRGAGIK